jgi:hypothetical protein
MIIVKVYHTQSFNIRVVVYQETKNPLERTVTKKTQW